MQPVAQLSRAIHQVGGFLQSCKSRVLNSNPIPQSHPLAGGNSAQPNLSPHSRLTEFAEIVNGELWTEILSPTDEALFNEYAEHICRELVPVIKNNEATPINLGLPDGTPITIDKQGGDLVLAMEDGFCVTLRQPDVATFYETLYQCAKLGDYAELETSIFNKLGWHGPVHHTLHPSLSELKSFDKGHAPYRSAKETPPTNLNGKVWFKVDNSHPNLNRKIVCRDISTQEVKDAWHNNGKPDLDLFSSNVTLADHVSVDTGIESDTVKFNAKRYDLIKNNRFGMRLFHYFNEMLQSQNKVSMRTFFVSSTDHRMAFILRVQDSHDKPFVVNFLDPNVSNNAVRFAPHEINRLKAHTLRDYIDGVSATKKVDGNYDHYFPEGADRNVVIYEYDPASLIPSLTPVDRRLSDIDIDTLTPTCVYFMLDLNMAHDLSKLEDKLLRIGQKSPDKLLSLLRASSYNGRPGLYMALQNGCAEAVLVFKALLEKVLPLIPKSAFDELLNILVAKRPDGLPGLVYAVLDDATETIEAYESLASILKPSQHALFIKHLTEVKEGSPFHSELMNPSSLIAISYYQMVSIVIGWRPNF